MEYTTVNVHLSTFCMVMVDVQPLAGPRLAVRLRARDRSCGDDLPLFRVIGLAARRPGW